MKRHTAVVIASAFVAILACGSEPSTSGGSTGGHAGAGGVTAGASAQGGDAGNAVSGNAGAGGAGAVAGAGTSSGGSAGLSGNGSAGDAGAGGVTAGAGGVAGGTSGAGGDAGASAGSAGSAGTAGAGGMGGAPYVPPAPARTETPLRAGWRFQRSDVTNASATTFDDSAWSEVSVPHTWNATDGQDGGNNYYRGVGWYRRHVMVPSDAAGKRLYLEFDGANIVTDVWVNGTSVGQHRGGFARFRFDVTSAMRTGADNVIAVRVSNARVTDVAPLDADFTFFGGLYRDVRLLATNALHVDVMDYASPGVYLDTTNVSAASANLRARVRVRNDETTSQSVAVRTVVVRADGGVEAELNATGTVAPGATEVLAATATVANPHLWDGIADPYVYRAYVEVRAGQTLVDWLVQPLGFRFYSVDPARGFFLNGRYLDLHGVNRHQDRLGMGWAIGTREHDEDMALIRELGANVVRLSHYQQAQYFHELADREGMVLWAEIPLVNAITDSTAFRNNAVQQLTELIRQNYNHPSILFWGIGNEQRSDNTPTNNLLATLATLVETEDPTRLSTYAQCCTSDTGGLPAHADIVGYNTYYGWYDAFGAIAEFGAWADNLHAQRPTWRIGISEWGAGASVVQHADNPPQPDPYGTPHPEEWQNLVHESHWIQMKARPYLWGKMIWAMFDFAVDGRDEGDTPGRNDKGLVTYDRRTKKDSFFWFKANWTTAPLVYITSRRFTPRTTATVPVKVYSNCDSVTLSVNGTSRGAGTGSDHIFRWTNVPLSAGQNTVQATATCGSMTVTDSVTWTRN